MFKCIHYLIKNKIKKLRNAKRAVRAVIVI